MPKDYIWYSNDWKDAVEKSYKNIKCEDVLFENKSQVRFFRVGDSLISVPFVDVGNPKGNITSENFKEILSKHGSKKILIKFNSFADNYQELIKALEAAKFHGGADKGQYILKLDAAEKIWNQKIDKRARTDVRKAESFNLNVKEIADKTDLRAFFGLYSENMRDFGSPQHSFKFFESLWDLLYPKSMIKGMNCYFENRIIGSIIGYLCEDYVYIIYNVSDQKHRDKRPNDLLYWKFVEWACKNKYKYIDFGQGDKNAQDEHTIGLNKYKEKWGADYYDKFTFSNREIKLGQKRYGKMRKIWAKLPLFLTKIIGPKIIPRLG